ncbi:MAG: aspartate carbamoyltransferase [Patescibacteria group bacterium]|nr:aspartate carbamoyltransferase [Patescibacteria group bacterium]
MQHILSAEQFDDEQLQQLFVDADMFRQLDQSIESRREVMTRHTGRIMLSMFYEPSTRTRFSFEIAATKLGIGVVGTENAAEFSSAAKGETIEDTVKVFNEYGVDAINMRTKEEGHADRAASVSTVAIINGGDGKGEHPTQAALDLYTIKEQTGRLENLNIVMGGDLARGRTVRSLSKLITRYPGNKITYVSTPELQIGNDIKAQLDEHTTEYEETTEMLSALREADVVYWTRLQTERALTGSDVAVGQDHFIIDKTALEVLPKQAIIMHPLPRVGEITAAVDADPRAQYFRQAGNGLYIRMAMLDSIMKQRD